MKKVKKACDFMVGALAMLALSVFIHQVHLHGFEQDLDTVVAGAVSVLGMGLFLRLMLIEPEEEVSFTATEAFVLGGLTTIAIGVLTAVITAFAPPWVHGIVYYSYLGIGFLLLIAAAFAVDVDRVEVARTQ
jgi:hypothetical protein